MQRNLSRRGLIAGSVTAGLGAAAFGLLKDNKPASCRGDLFRVAHMTDLHVHAGAPRKLTELALRHALTSHHTKPQLIVTGGDLIFDAMARTQHSVGRQWREFHCVFRHAHGVPVEHILGNHDIWGIDRHKCGASGQEPLYGKRWAMDELKLDRIYRSFDAGGWHWILLDDINPLPDKCSYEARLDEPQFEWLEAELKATDPARPVVIASHAPILASSVFFLSLSSDQARWTLPFMVMNAETRRITRLFEKYPNVKLCLSGHTHMVDRVEYKGVTYLGHGAVCGNWWQGPFQGFYPGYALVDLYPDGTFDSKFCTYLPDDPLA